MINTQELATMEDESNPPPKLAVPSHEEAARAELVAQYRIDSAFLKVGLMARILGLSATSIHAQIREGRFPVKHRRVGNVIMVKLTDFVDWYCADPNPPDASGPPREGDGASPDPLQPCLLPHFGETKEQKGARIKAAVLESIKLDRDNRAAARAAAVAPAWETPRERGARINKEALRSVQKPGR